MTQRRAPGYAGAQVPLGRTGRGVGADEALRMGLVNRVVPALIVFEPFAQLLYTQNPGAAFSFLATASSSGE